MAGQPPVQPPKLSYKSKAQREREEREREERERAEEEARQERLRQQRLVAERQRRQQEAAALAVAPTRPLDLDASPVREADKGLPPSPDALDAILFEEDREDLVPARFEDIEMLGAPEAEEEMGEEEVVEEVAVRRPRQPPRPPKSPDMRPVYAGFILVFTGLSQSMWGAWAMVLAPGEGDGQWDILPKWSMFVMGFIAVLLGLLAIRGGLWSFRKERFDVVKVGAIAATACVWALWVPWLFGALALLIVHKAKVEYYPYYDPRWDAPGWARPPPGEDGGDVAEAVPGEGTEEDGEVAGPAGAEGGEASQADLEATAVEAAARDFMRAGSPADSVEEQGLQEASVAKGDGWEDLG